MAQPEYKHKNFAESDKSENRSRMARKIWDREKQAPTCVYVYVCSWSVTPCSMYTVDNGHFVSRLSNDTRESSIAISGHSFYSTAVLSIRFSASRTRSTTAVLLIGREVVPGGRALAVISAVHGRRGSSEPVGSQSPISGQVRRQIRYRWGEHAPSKPLNTTATDVMLPSEAFQTVYVKIADCKPSSRPFQTTRLSQACRTLKPNEFRINKQAISGRVAEFQCSNEILTIRMTSQQPSDVYVQFTSLANQVV